MHPISYFQAVVFGLVQGVSELFPISSLGHAVVMPRLFGWNIHQNDKFFITFLVAVHLATALVLLGFFWRDWVRIIKGLGRSLRDREIADADARLGWLLVVGTIPAGHPRARPRVAAAQGVRLADVRSDLPVHQRTAAVRVRAAAPSRSR